MKNKRTLKRGGRFYGRGAFGSVMGDPRLPCADEKVEDIKDNREVSKISPKRSIIEDEINVMSRLNAVLSPEQIAHLRNYLVLPIKSCVIDMNKVNAVDTYKQDDWYKTKTGTYGDGLAHNLYYDRFTYDRKVIPHDTLHQIVYPIADSSISELIERYDTNRTEPYILMVLKHICELYDGLRELQKLDLVHGDIKSLNSVVIDGKAKFIDNADLTQVNITNPLNKEGFMKVLEWTTYASHYFSWSELVVMGLTEEYKDNNVDIDEVFKYTLGSDRVTGGLSYLIEQLKMMFRIFNDNRLKLEPHDKEQMLNDFIKICVSRLYGLTGMNTLAEPMNENRYDLRLVENIIQQISARSVYGYSSAHFEHPSYPEEIRRAIKDFKQFVNKLNTDLESDTGVASNDFRMKRMDYILKMNDIHSMGMLLMGFLLFIRPADVTDPLKPVLKKAAELGLSSLKQHNPLDIDTYYDSRHSHFNGVYSILDDLMREINGILNPVPFVASVSSVSRRSSPPRTVSRSSKSSSRRSKRRTPRRSARRRTVKRSARRVKSM